MFILSFANLEATSSESRPGKLGWYVPSLLMQYIFGTPIARKFMFFSRVECHPWGNIVTLSRGNMFSCVSAIGLIDSRRIVRTHAINRRFGFCTRKSPLGGLGLAKATFLGVTRFTTRLPRRVTFIKHRCKYCSSTLRTDERYRSRGAVQDL